MIKVIFVCLGNICRSPMAEGSFKKMLEEKQLSDKIFSDSAGTSSYHIGELADERMRKTALKHDINLTHRARQFVKEDLNQFDYILAMDNNNYRNIKVMSDEIIADKIFLMREFDKTKDLMDVPDPYYGGNKGFEEVYQIIQRSNEGFLNFLISRHNIR